MDANTLLSGNCYFCAASSVDYICAGCKQDQIDVDVQRCPVCAEREPEARICGRCLQQPPTFDATLVLCDYRYPLNRYLHSLKYQHRPELVSAIANELGWRLQQRCERLPQAVIPVPLHRRRQRQRGFNQAVLLARQLGRLLGVPVMEDVFIRSRDTASQSSLQVDQRRKNLRRAFKRTKEIDYRHVAICDDVVTTGATVNELARELRRAGCDEIEVWAAAKTPRG